MHVPTTCVRSQHVIKNLVCYMYRHRRCAPVSWQQDEMTQCVSRQAHSAICRVDCGNLGSPSQILREQNSALFGHVGREIGGGGGANRFGGLTRLTSQIQVSPQKCSQVLSPAQKSSQVFKSLIGFLYQLGYYYCASFTADGDQFWKLYCSHMRSSIRELCLVSLPALSSERLFHVSTAPPSIPPPPPPTSKSWTYSTDFDSGFFNNFAS